MPRLINQTPKYSKHRASGQAIVSLNGKDYYLGPWGSRASRIEYDRLVAEWLAGGRLLRSEERMTITVLLNSYREHCVKMFGEKGSFNIGIACRPLRRLFGNTPAEEFGPLKLKAVIAEYIKLGWCRSNINRHIVRVKGFFKWAVGNEHIPPSILHGLQAVSGLRRGQTEARESEPVRPATDEHAAAVQPFVSRQVWTMIQLQLLTGMRPGEVVIMRSCDIDTTGETWIYTPAKHKTEHFGKSRTIFLGPKAQEILRPWLRNDLQAYLFSPAEAEAERRAKLTAERKTPISYGNKPGSNRRQRPEKKPGIVYTREAYTRAIYAACGRAFPHPAEFIDAEGDSSMSLQSKSESRERWRRDHYWSPNQLRHTAATKIRREFGAEAAQTILGHTQLRTTEIYAEKNAEQAKQIMEKIG